MGKIVLMCWYAVGKVVYGLFLPLRCAFFARKRAGSGCFCMVLRGGAGGWVKKMCMFRVRIVSEL